MSPLRPSRLLLLTLPLLWGCTDSDDPLGPEPDEEPAVVTVDASAGWAYLSLTEDGPVPVTVGDPASSDQWDMAVFATSVMLNGGDAGPGGVEGFCVCNGAMTEAEVLAASEPTGLERFQAVGAAALPAAEDAWMTDELVASFSGWWSYDPVTHQVSPVTGSTWVVRTVEGHWARVRVTGMDGSTQAHAGTVTLEYQLQETVGGALAEARVVSLDASGGPVTLDLETGAAGAGEGWDLRLDGYTIRVNGGVSGEGGAGAVRVDEPFESIGDPSSVPSSVLRGDSFGGVFNGEAETRWYRYNLQGNHQIWPTYHVYLIRRDGVVHRVQIVGYYDAAATARQISVRSAPLEP